MKIELTTHDIGILLKALSRNPTTDTFNEDAYMHQKLIHALVEDNERARQESATKLKEDHDKESV